MDILRRNTDFALRAMVNLAMQWRQEPVSARKVAREEDIPYRLACKLPQELRSAGLVGSYRGPKGGFRLSREPSKISLLEVVRAIQGPVRVNRCLVGVGGCPLRPKCAVSETLIELENYIDSYLRGITLDRLLMSRGVRRKKAVKHLRGGKDVQKMKKGKCAVGSLQKRFRVILPP